MEIYKITNLLNSKIYIGKDVSSDPKYYGSGVIINNAIKKYGIENFLKEVIDTATSKKELSEKEKYWISHYNSTNREIGYNISNGGDGGDTISNNPNRDSINRKVSESSFTKGKTYEEAYGTEKALEYKKKLSESHKDRPPRKKKEKKLNVDGRVKDSKRWETYHSNKKELKNSIIENLKHKMEKDGFLSNIDEFEEVKKDRHNFGFRSIDDFYRYFDKFEIEIREYYKNEEFLNRSRANLERKYNKNIGEKIGDSIKNYRIKKARLDFQELVKIIEENSIEELEDYFSVRESEKIRKRYLKVGMIKDEVPEKYKNIIRKKRTKIPIWSEESKKAFEKKNGKEVEIDGIKYDSISGAAREIGVDRNLIRHKLSTGNWPDKFINKK
jgi:hypothetical protein